MFTKFWDKFFIAFFKKKKTIYIMSTRRSSQVFNMPNAVAFTWSTSFRNRVARLCWDYWMHTDVRYCSATYVHIKHVAFMRVDITIVTRYLAIRRKLILVNDSLDPNCIIIDNRTLIIDDLDRISQTFRSHCAAYFIVNNAKLRWSQ